VATPKVVPAIKNCLLAGLSKPELDRLVPHLTRLSFKHHDSLSKAGQKFKHLYFMESGIASVVSTLKNGSTVEVGVIGRDGLVGFQALIGTDSMPFDCFVQIPGEGFRVEVQNLQELWQRSPGFRQCIFAFFHAYLTQTAQTAACNRRHDVAERLARWLLTCRDRSETDELLLTHEFLGEMLGAPRTTVTLAARQLQNAGLIHYSRGRVNILRRKGLEKVACECYCVVRDEYGRLGVL
jgi:CRP-like cAMP-binding protein